MLKLCKKINSSTYSNGDIVFEMNGYSFSPIRYTNIEPVLNSIPIKLHRVFLSHNLVSVSSHYLIFHQHMYARQLSNRSMLHAGRYLNDKEICYLRTLILRANVCLL